MCTRALLALAVTALLLVGAAPAAGQYGGGTLTIDDPTLLPGQEFRLSGTGCLPGAAVEIGFDGRPMGTATADADGAWAFVGTMPLGTAPGEYLMRAICGDLDQTIVIGVPFEEGPVGTSTTSTTTPTQTTAPGGGGPGEPGGDRAGGGGSGGGDGAGGRAPAPGDESGSGRVPRTGSEVGPFARVAVVLVLTGTGIALLARRRAYSDPV
jgi:hypothetical protein